MRATCVICGNEFEKLRGSKTCGKECSDEQRKATDRRRRLLNPEKYRERNREKARRRRLRYPEKCREANREAQRRRLLNPEKNREMVRMWKLRHPEKKREQDRRCRLRNPDKIREAKRRHKAISRAARCLGVPRLLYVAMKLEHQHANGG